jgi:hypothetical protein
MAFEGNEVRIERLEGIVKSLAGMDRLSFAVCGHFHKILISHAQGLVALTTSQTAVVKYLALVAQVPEKDRQDFLQMVARYETQGELMEKNLADLKAMKFPTLDEQPPPEP